jgi:hypothetical protein
VVAKSIEERPAMGGRLRRSTTTTWVAFGGALALGIALMAMVWVGDLPPSVESARGAPAIWIDDDSLLGGDG